MPPPMMRPRNETSSSAFHETTATQSKKRPPHDDDALPDLAEGLADGEARGRIVGGAGAWNVRIVAQLGSLGSSIYQDPRLRKSNPALYGGRTHCMAAGVKRRNRGWVVGDGRPSLAHRRVDRAGMQGFGGDVSAPRVRKRSKAQCTSHAERDARVRSTTGSPPGGRGRRPASGACRLRGPRRRHARRTRVRR